MKTWWWSDLENVKEMKLEVNKEDDENTDKKMIKEFENGFKAK